MVALDREGAVGRAVSARRILTAAVLAQAALSFADQGVPTLVVFLKQDLALSAAAAGALVSAIGAGRLVTFYVAGRAVDRRGERRVLLVGAIGTGAAVAAAALFGYAGVLVAFFVAGAFLSTATPAGGKLVFTSVPAGRRSLAMGIRQAAVPAGGLAAAAILPAVAGWTSWRVSLVVAGAVCVAGGATLVALAGLGPRVESAPLQARAALAGLRGRAFVLTTLWSALLVGAQYAVLTFLAVDARARTGASAVAAAALLIAVHGAGMTGRVAWGLAADRAPRLRARALPAAVTALSVAAAAALALLPLHHLAAFVALALLCGISINGWQGLWAYRVTEIVGVERAGTATGVNLTFTGLAMAASTPAYGAVADAAGTMRPMWGVVACALGVALAAVALMPRERGAMEFQPGIR